MPSDGTNYSDDDFRRAATKVAEAMLRNVDEAAVDQCTVVTRVGSAAYNQYLAGGTALLIGKCHTGKGEEFAIFVTH